MTCSIWHKFDYNKSCVFELDKIPMYHDQLTFNTIFCCIFYSLFLTFMYFLIFLSFPYAVSQQDSVAGHGTYVEYVDSGLYATTAQGQSQM